MSTSNGARKPHKGASGLDRLLITSDRTARRIAHFLSVPVILFLKPFKLYAYRTRFEWLKRLILECTTFLDWAMIFANIQNETMLLHHRVWKGNFIFGKAVMVVDHGKTAVEIAGRNVRGSNFMGVNIVSSQAFVFATNSPVLNQSPPLRALTRAYIDEHMFDERVLGMSLQDVEAECASILTEWEADPDMAKMLVIRSTVTRIFLQVLAQTTITRKDATDVTFSYSRRFAEASLLGRYFPFLMGVLGTTERVRKDAYFKLQEYGIDPLTIGMTLFAAMFSVGTIVIKSIELMRRHEVDYTSLDARQKLTFVIECLRLYPTVTTVHRIVERDEEVLIAGRRVPLSGGDEIAYPFVCAHRDTELFPDPEALRLDRPPSAYASVLSFSAGPHACPGKDMGLMVTVMMLDALSRHYDLETLEIFSPIF